LKIHLKIQHIIPIYCCNMYVYLLGGASPFNLGVERTLDKLPSRGLYRSPLKYINCEVCISLEGKVCPFKKSLDSHKYHGQTFSQRTNSWRQNSQNVLPCKHSLLGGILFWPLAFSVKVEQTNFCSLPITLLELFVHSTNDNSVKRP
jgi:hypothetical protein